MPNDTKCPFSGTTRQGRPSQANAKPNWWPDQLDLQILHRQHPLASPVGASFNYAEAFASLDLDAVIADLYTLMTRSQPWWPADYGHYGPLFVRMAWHSAGTYRIGDGRGGAASAAQRFAPLNSWPDNVNLDKARRLLWPVKQKYGRKLSWADLIVLAGTVALESMGCRTLGFAGGRVDTWEPDQDIDWGSETEWLAGQRFSEGRQLDAPLAAVQMGLIYANPEGPNGVPDPLAAAADIRLTFARMAMGDEETVALIAGGHTFGKAHGSADPSRFVGAEPEAAAIEEQGLGWKNSYGEGMGAATISSGLEGAWTRNPIRWDSDFLDNLFGYDWTLTTSPSGAHQWVPIDPAARDCVPDAHDSSKRHAPIMFTTDLALRVDPAYSRIALRFRENPHEFADAFARAWFKLTHRDMGPSSRYLGPLAPREHFVWQDPVPTSDHALIGEQEAADLKSALLDCGLTVRDLVMTAWASAATFRSSDKRGGTNGARIRLDPQRNWEVNQPTDLARVLDRLEAIRRRFNGARADGTRVSLADLIVLGGNAAIEEAARKVGVELTVPFTPGRTDATQEQTDAGSFAVLEPAADGFRNYAQQGLHASGVRLLLDRASQMMLSAPEMTVLVGGMRVLGAIAGSSPHGLLTERPGTLTNDFFVHLLDMNTAWQKSASADGVFEGRHRATGELKWTATVVDLIFGSNAQLRAIAEFYASDDAQETFVHDFVRAWSKVMHLDRFAAHGTAY